MDAMNADALRQKYASDPGSEDRAKEFARCLGIEAGEPRRLAKAIRADLDGKAKGASTLRDLDFRRRVLISDTLLQAAGSVLQNLVEAGIHALETQRAVEQSKRADSSRLQPRRGQPISRMAPESPLEDIQDRMLELHLAGFFRAAASALDCLGIAAIGVLGLETPLLRGSLHSARQCEQTLAKRATMGQRLDDSLKLRCVRHISSAIDSAGPADWLSWTMGMRHMYVHRPRRLVLSQATPRPIGVMHSSGFPYLKTEVTHMLPRDPTRCDIDVMVDGSGADRLVLAEAAGVTVRGVLKSSSTVASAVCRRLRRVWAIRRRSPALIQQPSEQWKARDSRQRTSFGGYKPGQFVPKIDALFLPGEMEERFRAAAVFDHDRSLWASNPF